MAAGKPVRGGEIDDAARGVITQRGFGKYFTHRTGHSIDMRQLHGAGPHIDNFETREERLLVPGAGFSIEPGVYIARRDRRAQRSERLPRPEGPSRGDAARVSARTARLLSEHGGGQLRRELGVFSAAMMVVGGIIGSGIFFTPSVSARALPTADWVLAVWALGGVVAFAGALTYAELGAMIPSAGGAYAYIREAFGNLPAFLYGWMILASIATGAIAAVAVGFAGYLARLGIVPAGQTLTVAARGDRARLPP